MIRLLVHLSVLAALVASSPIASILNLADLQPGAPSSKIPLVRQQFSKRQASVPLSEEPPPQHSYVGTVDIDGGHTFTTTFDTGSGSFWIESSQCSDPDGGPCPSVPNLDPSTPGLTPTGKHVNVSYASASGKPHSAMGQLYSTSYSIGTESAAAGLIMLASRIIESADNPTSGILGLNFACMQPGACAINALGLSGFGYYISNDAEGGTAELSFNGADASKAAGPFLYEPKVAGPKWQVTVSSWSVAANSVGPGGSGQFPVTATTIDSGTHDILFDQTSAPAIRRAVGVVAGSDNTIACSGAPDIVFTFGSGSQYTLPSSVYVYNDGSGTCKALIGEKGSPTPAEMTFGATFMRAQYPYYDIANSRIGFAPSAGVF